MRHPCKEHDASAESFYGTERSGLGISHCADLLRIPLHPQAQLRRPGWFRGVCTYCDLAYKIDIESPGWVYKERVKGHFRPPLAILTAFEQYRFYMRPSPYSCAVTNSYTAYHYPSWVVSWARCSCSAFCTRRFRWYSPAVLNRLCTSSDELCQHAARYKGDIS